MLTPVGNISPRIIWEYLVMGKIGLHWPILLHFWAKKCLYCQGIRKKATFSIKVEKWLKMGKKLNK